MSVYWSKLLYFPHYFLYKKEVNLFSCPFLTTNRVKKHTKKTNKKNTTCSNPAPYPTITNMNFRIRKFRKLYHSVLEKKRKKHRETYINSFCI